MAKQDRMLKQRVEKLRLASMDPEIRMQYEAREKALRDIESIRDDALEEGKLEGKLEGKKEGKEEVALTLLKEGMDIQFVIRMTGLSKEVVEKIATKLDN
ncbi:hypothetical protein [Halalkalibacter alkaliphilus]|uniref:Rpn family recombination-promoting nuclease/putative transposase n=1 Tax=Halalkalibacter alkaliphilus TaxID=2917993 RepID=A0A9X2CPW8_9BACI|nr:hypothetical protein [Halalkalibacter alkaliphilus]MCL7746697.1 hypothetical protein [Halalkalibacter alkaliphilus]